MSEVSGGQLELLLEPNPSLPPLMQLTGASVVVTLLASHASEKLAAHVLRVEGRKLTVRLPQEFLPPERRRYFRLPLAQPVSVRVLQSWDPSLTGQTDEAMGDDLSGNGIRLTTRLPLRVGDGVVVFLSGEGGGVQLEGLVRRQLPAAQLLHTVGIQFNTLSRIQEERLVAYLLRRQTEFSAH